MHVRSRHTSLSTNLLVHRTAARPCMRARMAHGRSASPCRWLWALLLLQLLLLARALAQEYDGEGGEPAGDDPTAVEVILKALNDRNGNIRHAMPGVRGDVAFVRLVRATTQKAAGGQHHRVTLIVEDRTEALFATRSIVWAPDAGPWRVMAAGANPISSEDSYNENDHHEFHGESARTQPYSMDHHDLQTTEVYDTRRGGAGGAAAAPTRGRPPGPGFRTKPRDEL
mmetsp:Transcript_44940/g.134162  ORF Transcript_44940/g.134162 Transcript_44940/m.134162 type:complete len:227 (-) Transcript_44940:135-815(-)